MADGTFAVLMWVIGLTDMGMNYCGTETGCLGRSDAQAKLQFSAGQVVERRADSKSELMLRYKMGSKRGPFQPAVGLSLAEDGEAWIGFGQTYTMQWGSSPFYAELHAMPGLYSSGGGFELGGPIAFRSGIEVGFENRRGWQFGLSFDHRSNAGIYEDNPGIETVQFRVSIPTN